MVRAEIGQPANMVRLADNLKDVQQLYGSRGFLTASDQAGRQFDNAAGTVAFVWKSRKDSSITWANWNSEASTTAL